MIHVLATCLLCLLPALLSSQSLTRFEYWFDNQFSARTSASLSGSDVDYALDVDTRQLSTGLHTLRFRVRQSDGLYSPISSSLLKFCVVGNPSQLEYWFDDEGVAKAKQLSGNAASDGNGYVFVNELDMSSLSNGYHSLYFRARSSDGRTATTIVRADVLKYSLTGNVSQLEYWFDNENLAQAKVLSGNAASDGNGYVFVNELDMSSLSNGYHSLYFRARSSDGRTATSVTRADVLKFCVNSNTSLLEYWFDDEGVTKQLSGNAASDGNGYVFVKELDVSGLKHGAHHLYYRAKSADGHETTPIASMTIYVAPSYDNPLLTAYSISIDDGECIVEDSLTPQKEMELNYTLDASSLTSGSHTVKTTFWNSYGMSLTDVSSFVVKGSPSGDVNGDGQVGIGDIVAVTNVMAGITNDEATRRRADVNGDGQVGIGDIVAITNIMAGTK